MVDIKNYKEITSMIKSPIIYFKKYSVSAGMLSVMINILMLTGSIFMLEVYGRVIPAKSSETLIFMLFIVFFSFLMMAIADFIRSKILGGMALEFMVKTRKAVFDLITNRGMSTNSYLSLSPFNDLKSIAAFIGGAALSTLYDIPLMIIYFVALFFLHPYFLIFAIFSAIALFSFSIINHIYSLKPQKKLHSSSAKVQEALGSILRNLESIRSMGMRKQVMQNWRKQHDENLWWETQARERTLGLLSITKALRLFLQSAVLALGAWLVLRGELDAGSMIVGSILLGRALQPIEQSIMLWKEYQKYKISKSRLLSFIQSRLSQVEKNPKLKPEETVRGFVDVMNLYVIVPGVERPVLKNINFSIPSGSILLVTGENGSGKTILSKTLAGALLPSAGHVLVDGADIRTWPEKAWGEIIGYLPQDIQLIEGSIAQNIGRFHVPDERAVIKAARQAGVHEAIKNAGGYDRPVGPDGAWLPRGVQQRVALARALYGEPRLIILDEPEAGLDEAGVESMFEAISNMKKRGQTVMVISHSPAMQEVADYLLVLGDGEVRRLARKV